MDRRVPLDYIGGWAELPELFLVMGRDRGIPAGDIRSVLSCLPEEVLSSPCFLDTKGSRWRYVFGEPITDHRGRGVLGPDALYPSVESLFDVSLCAHRRLQPDQLSTYCQRLRDPAKHQDWLYEFAPIIRLPADVETEYEVRGFGEGNNKTIDWAIQAPHGRLLLLEVKRRQGDLVEAFSLVTESGAATMLEPKHDPALLFASVETKFKPRPYRDVLHAVWIYTAVKQEEQELLASFRVASDPDRVHAAILGDFNDDVYILTSQDTVRRALLELLRVHESRRFVFRRGERPG